MEILHRQTSNGQKQVRLQFCNHVLQCVLAKIGQVHECRDASCELDQLFLHKLALGLVFPFLIGELLLLFLGQLLVFGFVLEFLDLLALVDDGLDNVVAQRTPALDTFYSGHRLRVVEESA